jgi:hypothetical protein
MIPPRDPIKASFPPAAWAIDAATVLARLAAGARCHPDSHPSEPRRPLAPSISRRAETATIIRPAAPRRVTANRQRLIASITGSAQSP